MTVPSPHRSFLILAIFVVLLPVRVARGQAENEAPVKEPDPIRLRYAQLNLELAQTQLKRRVEQNEKIPNFYSEGELRRYRMNVSVAEKQLDAAKRGADAAEIHLQRAKEQMEVSKADYQRFVKAREAKVADPIVYNEFELNELRLKAEMAKLRFAIWSEPESNLLSIFDHMHWQLELLSEEVLDLQRRFDSLEKK